jgi:hypothetical protein
MFEGSAQEQSARITGSVFIEENRASNPGTLFEFQPAKLS